MLLYSFNKHNEYVKYDLNNKHCLKSYYNEFNSNRLEVKCPKEIIFEIKQISVKKTELLLKATILFYFILFTKPNIRFLPLIDRPGNRLLLNSFFSVKKLLIFQTINYIDYIFSFKKIYNTIFSFFIKCIFRNFFKKKKRNNSIVSISKL